MRKLLFIFLFLGYYCEAQKYAEIIGVKPINTIANLQTSLDAKQNAITNPITGTGTTNYLPKFTGASSLGNSLISDDGTNISIAGVLSFSKNISTLPVSGLGGTFSANKSGGNAEVNIFNTYDSNPASTAFIFSQKTGTSTSVDLLTIMRTGYTGIGTITPIGIFDVTSTTSPSYPFPRMTTTQVNALTGMLAGAMVFDTTTGHPKYYSGTAWVQL